MSASSQPGPAVPSPSEGAPATRSAWRLASWVAGIFSLLVAAELLAAHWRTRAVDFLNSPQLKEHKQALQLNPADEPAKRRIRELDLQLRQAYFLRLSRAQSGIYLLLGGVAAFVLAATQSARCRRQLPMPQPRPDAAELTARTRLRARWSVAATGAAIGVLLFGLNLSLTTALPRRPMDVERLLGAGEQTVVTSDAASPEEFAVNWPRFRGPDGGGVSHFTDAPTNWDVKTGAGIVWKTAVPAGGFSSPVVWDARVFFSGSDGAKREIFCLDLNSGRPLWREAMPAVASNAAQGSEVPESTGYAAASMATDGRRVYAMFASGELAAFTLDGKRVWSKNFGALKNPYGHATSLATWRDRLLVQLDQGESEDNKSRLYALDGRTGQIAWQRPRKVGSSWATPIVIDAAGQAQVITLAMPCVVAYSVAEGTELWRVECLNGEITPSPVFAGGLVLVASPSEKLLAIRPDGRGDVTKTHVSWTTDVNVPDVTSPVSDGRLVFTLTTPGELTCFGLKDGQKQWEHEFGMEFHASPALAGGRLYLFSQKGTAVVVEAARQFRELFRTEMGDAFHASPALLRDRIILRGVTNVWCLGARSEPEKVAERK